MEGLLEWHSNFVLADPSILITDNGSHFANQVMQYAVHALRGRHEFSIPFAPFTNGSCENRNRHVVRILRQLCSELSLTDRDWPVWVAITAGSLNNLPILNRANETPKELF